MRKTPFLLAGLALIFFPVSIDADTYLYDSGLRIYQNGKPMAIAAVSPGSPAGGGLITSFGNNGTVASNPTSNMDEANAMAQDDDYIYAAGFQNFSISGSNKRWRVEKRRKSDGNLVSGFGVGGVIFDSGAYQSEAKAIAVDENYIYIAGATGGGLQNSNQWFINKIDKNTGNLNCPDCWIKLKDYGVSSESAKSIALDSDYIYIAGSYSTNAGSFYYPDAGWKIEKRRKSDGNYCNGVYCPAFDGDGIIIRPPTPNPDPEGSANAIAVDDNSLYVAGSVGLKGSQITERFWKIEKINKENGILEREASERIFVAFSTTNDGVPYALALDNDFIYIGGHFNFAVLGRRIEKRKKSDLEKIWFVQDNKVAPWPYHIEARGITVDGTGVYVAGYSFPVLVNDSERQWTVEKLSLVDGRSLWLAVENYASEPIDRELAMAIINDADGLYIAGYDFGPGSNNSQWRIEKRDKTTFPYISNFGLKVYKNGQIIDIAIENGSPTSPLRISKNGQVYGIILLDI